MKSKTLNLWRTASLIALLVLFPLAAGAASSLSENILPWTPNAMGGVGHIGGLPPVSGTARNVVDYGADATGENPSDSAVANARAAMRDGDYLYFPRGRFKLAGSIANWRGGVIRGSGMDTTTLVFTTGESRAIGFGVGSSLSNPNGPDDDVLSPFSRGTNTITLPNVNDFIVGGFVCIFFSNDTNRQAVESGLPIVLSAAGGEYARRHMARVTSVSGKTITFEPALFHNPAPNQTAYARASQIPSYNCGLENLTIDLSGSNATFGVTFEDVYGGWMQGVRIKAAARYHLFVFNNMYFEMRECVLEDGKLLNSTNTSGLLMQNCTGSLIEDNAFIRVAPGIEINFGSANNVFAFNYFDGAVANINHGPLNQYNLYEGNIIPQIKSDGYFGGSHYDCIFGNWLTGRFNRTSPAQLIGLIELKRFTYKSTVVRNFFGTPQSSISGTSAYENWGTPNIGNNSSSGTSQASQGLWWIDWDPDLASPRTWTGRITSGGGSTSATITMDKMDGTVGFAAHVGQVLAGELLFGYPGGGFTCTAGQISGNTIRVTAPTIQGSPSTFPPNGTDVTGLCNSSSMQQKDLDVMATSYRARNYYLSASPNVTGFVQGEAPVDPAPPRSLFRSSAPAWFGNKRWPAFDTVRQEAPNYTDLPAAHRYILGNRDYITPGEQPAYIGEVRIFRL
ncbi:glycosyl hydrolase family 28-related protein [Horticoccus sp. 23ND18S-11]|uniref:glycosyl hydrolase family 28-related protein n=1 Tax=Horticoccus sp. 23ND18S-11 TaxID=3391832 RepID=UPI0039C990CC